jgi:hypothetical protein
VWSFGEELEIPTTRKHAWFNLVIVVFCAIAVISLTPVLGIQRAQGGFGMLGFLGLGPLVFRGKPGTVVNDERDEIIRGRSVMIAYGVFWVLFVAACVSAPFFYGSGGAIPVWQVQMSVGCGLIIVVGVSSIAALVQYRAGGVG